LVWSSSLRDFGEPRTGLLDWSVDYSEPWTGPFVWFKTVRLWFSSDLNHELDLDMLPKNKPSHVNQVNT
jgi:hypothetical protein